MPKDKIYQTILVICLGLMVLSILAQAQWLLLLVIAIGALASASEKLARLIERSWLKLAEVLGKVMSRLILALVFFLVLTPIAFLYRLSGKDPLLLKSVGKSTFKERNHIFEASDLEKPW